MALGGRPDAFDALRRDQHRRGVAGRRVVDDVIEIEGDRGRRALVAVLRFAVGILDAHPFVGLARVVQAQIVVDRLGRQDGRQALGQRLQAVERAVAADGDQSFDAERREAVRDEIELGPVVRIDVVARRTDERAALGRIELGIAWNRGLRWTCGTRGLNRQLKPLISP